MRSHQWHGYARWPKWRFPGVRYHWRVSLDVITSYMSHDVWTPISFVYILEQCQIFHLKEALQQCVGVGCDQERHRGNCGRAGWLGRKWRRARAYCHQGVDGTDDEPGTDNREGLCPAPFSGSKSLSMWCFVWCSVSRVSSLVEKAWGRKARTEL